MEVARASASEPGGTDHCLSSFYPVRIDGQVVGVGVVVVDISGRRRAEGLLAANLDALVHTIATTVEFRDPYTAGHQTRVAHLAGAIGRELSWTRPMSKDPHRRWHPRHRQDRGAGGDIEQAGQA